jgi:hypothetical protein
MPNEASGETADRIKKMIKENRKFILLATNGTIASKWCNWELGFGDADKYHEHIAIMPIAEDDGSWKGNEYLQIYPSIQTDSNNKYSNYYVEFKGKKVNLIDWLKT